MNSTTPCGAPKEHPGWQQSLKIYKPVPEEHPHKRTLTFMGYRQLWRTDENRSQLPYCGILKPRYLLEVTP